MEELIPYVKAMFPVTEDPQDTFLAGIGMDGVGDLCLGMNEPELTWAYLDQKLTGILDWLMAL